MNESKQAHSNPIHCRRPSTIAFTDSLPLTSSNSPPLISLLIWIVFLVVALLAFHHFLLSVPFLLHLLLSHLLLVRLHLSKFFFGVLLHLVWIHLLSVAVLPHEFVLVLAAVLAGALLVLLLLVVLIDLVLQLDSIAANVDLIRLRYDLIANDARLAVQAT